MKANELRIGNLVRLNNPKYHYENTGKNFMIDSIKTNDVSLIDYENLPSIILYQYIKYIEPIELTEEWLVKFGQMWGNSDNGRYRMYYNLEDNHLYSDDNFANCNRISWIEIKYVHQLQNLYFALTGEELTIN